MDQNGSRKKYFVVGIAVLGLILLALAATYLFVIWRHKNQPAVSPLPGSQASTTATQASVPQGQPLFAAPGVITSGFPKALILDSNAQTAQSYAINYGSSTNQYTAVYYTSLAMTDMYQKYQAYLQGAGWTITNAIASNAVSRGLYATQGSSTVVSIGIVPQGTGSQITVSYINQ